MLGWIRDRLRAWLLDPPPEPPAPSTIEVRSEGRITRARIIGAQGLYLMIENGRGVLLIGEVQAVDKREFWRAWKHWQTDEVTWEDGSVFEPPGEQR